VVSTNVPSAETHAEDKQDIQQEKTDAQPLEHGVPIDIMSDDTKTDRQGSFESFITDTTISTSPDTTSITIEPGNEQKEMQETISEETSASEIPVRLYFRNQQLGNLT
jgi:hypothetical protein